MSDQSFNETIPGGKYLAADGKTFIDAWGKPIADQDGDEEQGASLDRLSRADLEAMAVEAGMSEDDATKAKNKQELVEFLESQTSPLVDQAEGGE